MKKEKTYIHMKYEIKANVESGQKINKIPIGNCYDSYLQK